MARYCYSPAWPTGRSYDKAQVVKKDYRWSMVSLRTLYNRDVTL